MAVRSYELVRGPTAANTTADSPNVHGNRWGKVPSAGWSSAEGCPARYTAPCTSRASAEKRKGQKEAQGKREREGGGWGNAARVAAAAHHGKTPPRSALSESGRRVQRRSGCARQQACSRKRTGGASAPRGSRRGSRRMSGRRRTPCMSHAGAWLARGGEQGPRRRARRRQRGPRRGACA